MQQKCDKCGSIVIPGSGACWQCGYMHSYAASNQFFDSNQNGQCSNPAAHNFTHGYTQNPSYNYNSAYSGANYNNPFSSSFVSNMGGTMHTPDFTGSQPATKRQETNQKIFAIINMVLGVFSLVLVGLFLGIFALTTAMRASTQDNGIKKINKALIFNLIALAISIIAIVIIVILTIFFGSDLFSSGFVYY